MLILLKLYAYLLSTNIYSYSIIQAILGISCWGLEIDKSQNWVPHKHPRVRGEHRGGTSVCSMKIATTNNQSFSIFRKFHHILHI